MSAQRGSPPVSGCEGKAGAPHLPLQLDRAEPTPAAGAARQSRGSCIRRSQVEPRGLRVNAQAAAVHLCQRIQRRWKKLTRKPFVYRVPRPDDLSQLQFPCAGAQAIWENHIEAGQRNSCAIRLASELRQLGPSAEETAQKLLEWNERNEIELPTDELRSVVRSAYQHRFPYRYSCREIFSEVSARYETMKPAASSSHPERFPNNSQRLNVAIPSATRASVPCGFAPVPWSIESDA